MAKILYADDSATARTMGKSILGDAGHEVLAVTSAEEARRKLSEFAPEVLLLDVFMSGEAAGLELAHELRANEKSATATLILVVSKMESWQESTLASATPDAVVTKPFEATELLAQVSRAVEAAKGRRKPDYSALDAPAMVPQYWPASAVAQVWGRPGGQKSVPSPSVEARTAQEETDAVTRAVQRVLMRLMPTIVAEVRRELER